MDYLKKYQKRINDQINQIDQLVDAAVFDQESDIAEKIRARWKIGQKPDGSAIGVYKSHEYAEQKNELNPAAGFGFVDLTLTGSTGRKLKVSKYGSDYEIYSQDEKYFKIAKKYGDENFNLRPAETKEVQETVEVKVLKQCLAKTYK